MTQTWGFNGNARQFAVGPVADKEGRLHVFLDARGARWEVPFRGWDARFSRAGKDFEGWASGFHSPGGAASVNGEVFVTDNSGPWVPAAKLIRVHESPSVQGVDGTPVVVRRFELSASYLELEFTAHMVAGRQTAIGQSSAAMGILREKDVLLVAFRGRPLL
ncbi:MAG: hypothetical protein ACKODH_05165, partial [Limisphaerales bacterium]